MFLLTLVTFGIYGIVWQVQAKNEMNARSAAIPTAWLMIVSSVNLWWLWKCSEGVEHVTRGKLSGALTSILMWILVLISMLVVKTLSIRMALWQQRLAESRQYLHQLQLHRLLRHLHCQAKRQL